MGEEIKFGDFVEITGPTNCGYGGKTCSTFYGRKYMNPYTERFPIGKVCTVGSRRLYEDGVLYLELTPCDGIVGNHMNDYWYPASSVKKLCDGVVNVSGVDIFEVAKNNKGTEPQYLAEWGYPRHRRGEMRCSNPKCETKYHGHLVGHMYRRGNLVFGSFHRRCEFCGTELDWSRLPDVLKE